MKLYRQLAAEVSALIRNGSLRPGDRVPSVRQLCRDRGLSPATVMHAYEVLEAQGLIEPRARSGYFVAAHQSAHAAEPPVSNPAARSTRVDISELVFQVLDATRDRAVIPLGSAFPSPLLFPLAKLARHLGSAARSMNPWRTVEDLPPGSADLRRQIARRYLQAGVSVEPGDIIITSGALEALNLSLQAVTRPGDIVAIESPAFYACLQSIEAMGLRALEIPTHPRGGVDLSALAQALAKHPVRACWLMTTFQNPLGALMPEEARRDLVRLLAKHDVPLVEDNVYAELYFGREHPQPALAYDRRGLVLDCGSFSKSLAPGYRIGWVAGKNFVQAIQRRKVMTSLSASIPVQNALASYLRDGAYDRHLRTLRRTLAAQQKSLLDALERHLPAGFRVTRPQGGYMLWVELADNIDAIEVHRRALDQGFSVAPGPIFSARREFRNCIRLNYGHPWSQQLDNAIRALGKIVGECRAS